MPETPPAIDVRGLAKRFGDVRALDGFDLRVEPGTIHALVGPNGAGKTTFLRVLFGLVTPDEGSVTVLGNDPDSGRGGALDGVAGFVEEPRAYPYLTARRNLELLADLDGVDPDLVDDVLEMVRLGDRADHKVGGFSSGMRQRLGLAAALLRNPRLLLLDEPTVGLDPAGAREVQAVLREVVADGGTVLLSSHNMNELEDVCDAVTVLREGRSVWQGSMDRLRSEAPAPAHRLWTNDDARATEIADGLSDVDVVSDPEGWLTVGADRGALDAYVVALGREGVAIRRLELLMTALESMFFALTGSDGGEPAGPGARSDEVGSEVTT